MPDDHTCPDKKWAHITFDVSDGEPLSPVEEKYADCLEKASEESGFIPMLWMPDENQEIATLTASIPTHTELAEWGFRKTSQETRRRFENLIHTIKELGCNRFVPSLDGKFRGACDRIRQTEEGETFWQNMMKNKKAVSEQEFLKNVDVSDILDEDETWDEYKLTSPNIKFYKSGKNTYFFQASGFEFIWCK